MNDIYAMIGITKQGFYRRLLREKAFENKKEKILEIATQIRVDHKKMGCRKLYHEIAPYGIGRDRTEKILLDNGFRLPGKRSYHRTTYAGKRFYNNFISGAIITGKNKLFVSDITYIPIGFKQHYYLTLVLDVYIRVIKGWALSETMRVEDTVEPAFLMSIKDMTQKESGQLIFHSDKGSQYGSDLMKIHFKRTGVKPSMGGKAWENAHAESLNGILKNEYINFENVDVPLKAAKKMMVRWVWLYNNGRPHGSLNKMKPTEFENYAEQLAAQHKPKYKINY
jgi:putative transposase